MDLDEFISKLSKLRDSHSSSHSLENGGIANSN
jgi:hypothetical protein